jgi:glutathione synthase/RimK-type ligase-like ATP-grasp enzyme
MHLKHVAILTVEEDIHALVIQKAFEDYDDISCHIIETNRISGNLGLSWSNRNAPNFGCTIPTTDGNRLEVNKLDVIWWRRVNFPQRVPSNVVDPIHIDLINNDCKAAFVGLLLNEFSGSWIIDPATTIIADNKLAQLRAAQRAGLRTPTTLVSQNPAQIKRFCAMFENVIVKYVQGTSKTPLLTRMVSEEHLADEDSLRLCPAIYQEYIPGNQHIRAHCFGDTVLAALIESEDVDWRQNLTVPFEVFDLDETLKVQLCNVLRALGLKMGIFDLKLLQGSRPVWLEVNPQGQFLFTEGLSGLELTSAFTEFLYQEAKQAPDNARPK